MKIKVKFGVKLTGEEYKKYTLHGIFPALYEKEAKKPVDENKIVFIVVRHTGITNSFSLLYDRLMREYSFDIRVHFLRSPFASRAENIVRCREMTADIATAKYVFIDDGCAALACLPLRKETVVAQLWHGCGAFKKFGMSTAELIFGNSREEQLRFPNHGNYTVAPVSSPEVVWAYEEAFNLKENSGIVTGLGCSRTDIFYDNNFIEKAKEKFLRLMPSAAGKKVILYAPTFRGRVKKAAAPDMLDVGQFFHALSDEYVLIFKHHPLVKKPPAVNAAYADFAADFTDAMSIEELLCVANICISDYSSLIFEFSLFEKPMIFYAFDLDEYFDWRGFYYDYDELTPGPVFKSNADMLDYIKNISARFDREQVKRFREKFMSACDGHATDRIMNAVFKDALSSHEKPVSERKELAYHLVPRSSPLPSQIREKMRLAKEKREKLQKIYSDACRNTVDEKKVVFINPSSVGAQVLIDKLSENGEIRLCVVPKGTPDEETAQLIADAKVIVLSGACTLTDSIRLRPESRLIQLWKHSLPLNRFACSSLEHASGISPVLPVHRNYGFVPVASQYAAKALSESFGCDEDVMKIIGSVHTDIFFDEERKAEVREKIQAAFPQSDGKKIIFYAPESREKNILRPKKRIYPDFRKMYEGLKNEYVIICFIPAKKAKKMPVLKYFGEFVFNASGSALRQTEVMAVSDIAVGDYGDGIFDFLACGKPMFFYAPDAAAVCENHNTLTDYFELTEKMRVTDTDGLIHCIVNINNYDFTRLKKIKNRFLPVCDGKAAERTAQYVVSQIG
ncbi:MAG: CDP-glycerol glycerophosphotransferase family protein [Clostridia bacterium]|nr:CDP-glycerol glycerophosphotransferase family protein [Clostridia bacterium]